MHDPRYELRLPLSTVARRASPLVNDGYWIRANPITNPPFLIQMCETASPHCSGLVFYVVPEANAISQQNYAAIAFRFLRQPSRPSAPRPVKSWSVAGTATLETGVNVTDTPLPPRHLKLSP